jgi:HD-like signal output (HDOD) protein
MSEINRELIAVDWSSPELPTLPGIAHKLIQIAGKDFVEPDELEEIISMDPTLSLKILQAANSAFYALRTEVTSVRHAIMLLGFKEVRQIAMGTVLARRFMTVPQEVRREASELWMHLFATAVFAKDMDIESEEPDLYTLGLLHDLGLLVVLAQAPRVYKSMIEEMEVDRLDAERIWGVDHQLWGGKLAAQWELPHAFQVVARYHHEPELCRGPGGDYLYMIYLANHLATVAGFAPFKNNTGFVPDSILEKLGIDRETLTDMEEAAVSDSDRIHSMCAIVAP